MHKFIIFCRKRRGIYPKEIKLANIRLHKVIPWKETFSMIPFDDLSFVLEQLARFGFKAVNSTIKNKISKKL